MPIPAGSVIVECAIVGRQAGQRVLNLFHYYDPTGLITPTLFGAIQMANDFYTLATAAAGLPSLCNPAYTIERCSAQLIFPTRFVRGDSTPAAPVPGTRAGTVMASSTQWAITTVTDAAGPGGHGGNHYAGLNIADQAASVLTDAFMALIPPALQTLYQGLVLNGVAVAPIVYRRSNGLLSNEIAAFDVEREVRTMRRRVVGRGI